MSTEVRTVNPGAVAQEKVSSADSMKWLLKVFYAIVIGESLEAYAVGPVPLSWISVVLALSAAAYLLFQYPEVNKYYPKKCIIFYILFVYMLLNTFFHFGEVYDLAQSVGIGYLQYLCLRLMNILYLISICHIVAVLHAYGYEKQMITFLLWDTVIVCIIAIYVYFAYFIGLPIFAANRVTTSGATVSTGVQRFSYAFHRAYGTFREPGLLAAWLLLPCSLLVMTENLTKRKLQCLFLMLFVLLLTGSLAGALGFLFGLFLCIIMLRFPRFLVKRALLFTLFIIVLLCAFQIVQFAVHNEGGSYLETLWERFSSILDYGVEKSNRGYVYEFLDGVEPGVFGTGIGQQQIRLAHYYMLNVPVSLLSLFLNYLYSGGYFAIFLLLLFFSMLVFPFFFTSGEKRIQLINSCAGFLMAFLALILIATSQAEEFTFPMCCSIAFILIYLQNKTVNPDDTK